MNRRDVLALSLLTTASANWGQGASGSELSRRSTGPTVEKLRQFIAQYLVAMNAPGLAIGTASAQGALHAATYGYADVAAKIKASPNQLFEIGSITKSFAAIVVLQLNELGKVDLQAPIRDYLPWLSMQENFGEVRVHHLLTHSSGMPADPPLFPVFSEQRPIQTFKPGSQFHYCNWGYEVLGKLIEEVEGRSWPIVVSERVLTPLGMRDTVAMITNETRPRIIRSYVPLQNDRPFPRQGPVAPAGQITFTSAAGSIASTAHDMSLYMQMLIGRGVAPKGRILSEASFMLFATPHVPAPMFGAGAGYGYGIAIDRIDGRTRLKHTGGAASFMSAMQVDMDAGIGAFVSINAQLGYRPNAVAQYALKLYWAEHKGEALPPLPRADEEEAVAVRKPSSYAGSFSTADHKLLEIVVNAEGSLSLRAGNIEAPLEYSGDDEFIAHHPQFLLFPLVFGRESKSSETNAAGASAPVTELAYGPDWYTNAAYRGSGALHSVQSLKPYEGTFTVDNPWYDTARVVQRQGVLWLGGTLPLAPIGNHLFRLGADPNTPETAEFGVVVNGVAQVLRLGGVVLQRIGGALA